MKGKPKDPLPARFGPSESPGLLLWKVSNAWQRRQRAALAPLGLTHAQFVLLATATWYGATETLTQARLAELAGVDPMTTSQVVRTLEAAGLVERRAHPADPRAKAIFVTKAGKDKAHAGILVVEETDVKFIAPIAAQSERWIKLLQALLEQE